MAERDTLIETLARHRGFLLQTARGLTEEQARTRSTVSQLTIAGLLKHVAEVDLDSAHLLSEAPWFEPGTSWTVRRVALHLLAEISQHAGHADIIREAIDGQRTMG